MIMSFLVGLSSAPAQEIELPSRSPRAEVMQQVGLVEIRVNYARPAKRGRPIWGGLVPYDDLWRTGANFATTIEVSDTVKVGNADLEAGKYAIFTVPRKDSWTVVFNSNPDQGGTSQYDEALDVARLQIAPTQGPDVEHLTFQFRDITDDSAALDLMWDGVLVSVPITVDTSGTVDASVQAFPKQAARRLAQAARHYATNEEGSKAVEAANLAVRLDETWYTLWAKALALQADGERRQAVRTAKLTRKRGDEVSKEGSSWFTFWRPQVEDAIRDW